MTKEQLFSEARLRGLEAKLEKLSGQFLLKSASHSGKLVLDHFEFMQLFNISRRTSQNWRQTGRIPYSLIGGRIYFSLEDVLKLLQENKISRENAAFGMQHSELGMQNSELGMQHAGIREVEEIPEGCDHLKPAVCAPREEPASHPNQTNS